MLFKRLQKLLLDLVRRLFAWLCVWMPSCIEFIFDLLEGKTARIVDVKLFEHAHHDLLSELVQWTSNCRDEQSSRNFTAMAFIKRFEQAATVRFAYVESHILECLVDFILVKMTWATEVKHLEHTLKTNHSSDSFYSHFFSYSIDKDLLIARNVLWSQNQNVLVCWFSKLRLHHLSNVLLVFLNNMLVPFWLLKHVLRRLLLHDLSALVIFLSCRQRKCFAHLPNTIHCAWWSRWLYRTILLPWFCMFKVGIMVRVHAPGIVYHQDKVLIIVCYKLQVPIVLQEIIECDRLFSWSWVPLEGQLTLKSLYKLHQNLLLGSTTLNHVRVSFRFEWTPDLAHSNDTTRRKSLKSCESFLNGLAPSLIQVTSDHK